MHDCSSLVTENIILLLLLKAGLSFLLGNLSQAKVKLFVGTKWRYLHFSVISQSECCSGPGNWTRDLLHSGDNQAIPEEELAVSPRTEAIIVPLHKWTDTAKPQTEANIKTKKTTLITFLLIIKTECKGSNRLLEKLTIT